MENNEDRQAIENIYDEDSYEDLERKENARNARFKAILAALLAILAIITGLRAREIKNTKANVTDEIEFEDIIDEETPRKPGLTIVSKIFEPGTHIYSKRYSYKENGDPTRQIDVPDGYEVFSIQDYIGSWGGTGGHTKGVDVFFINNKTVEAFQRTIVTGYDSKGNKCEETGFFEPGIVIERELDNNEGQGLYLGQ